MHPGESQHYGTLGHYSDQERDLLWMKGTDMVMDPYGVGFTSTLTSPWVLRSRSVSESRSRNDSRDA